MEIDKDEIVFQIGWENEDFKNFKHTIIATYKNLVVKFKIDDIIYDDLKSRLIRYKTLKRLRKAIEIFPVGGYMKYSL